MRKSMLAALCALALVLALTALPASGQPPPLPGGKEQPVLPKVIPQDIDGQWTVVYVEIEGKKFTDKEFTNVTIKENVLRCKHDGKDKSFRLEFGPYNTVKCSEILAKTREDNPNPGIKGKDSATPGMQTHVGVYIASQEYLCFAMNKRNLGELKKPKDIGLVDRRNTEDAPLAEYVQLEPVAGGGPAAGMASRSGFVMILRRTTALAPDKGR
jgi:hypothetical protein